MDSPAPGPWCEPTISLRMLRPFLDWSSQLSPALAPRVRSLRELAHGERVSLSSFSDWLEHASQMVREPNLGLRALSHLARGDGDIVEVGCESAETLSEALHFLVAHARILNQAADFQLWIDGQFATLELRSRAKLSPALLEFQAGAVFHALYNWLGDVTDFQVWFSYPAPAHADLHRAIFAPGLVRFDAPCDAIVFKSYRLNQRLVTADPTRHAVLRRCAEKMVAAQREERPLVPRVREILVELLPRGTADANAVAKRVGMSTRTLTRRLEREETSFRELIDEVRHQSALRYLEMTNLTLSRVAELLGYAETASFCRAFLRWRGESALSYRRSCRSESGSSEHRAIAS
ncbi:MAG TPA: AraC family transcriptional regulator ligand-binding domain-containing protein [Polyangiales bacterium]